MLVSDGGTGLEPPRGLPDETIVRAIRVIDRTTTVSLALLGLLILVRIVAGPAGLVDWLTAPAVLVGGAGLPLARAPRASGRAGPDPPRPTPSSRPSWTRCAGRPERTTSSSPACAPPTASSRPRSSPRASPCPHRARPCPPPCWCRPRGPPTPPPPRRRGARAGGGRAGPRAPASGLRHTLDAPLWADGAVIGVLLLSRRTGESWTAADHELLESAAGGPAGAAARVPAPQAAGARAR